MIDECGTRLGHRFPLVEAWQDHQEIRQVVCEVCGWPITREITV